tara:strand:- start:625 stop:1968 length:1344 start_codon:yes stop_codon:yes gene_type:complete
MKIPEKAPDWQNALPSSLEKAFKISSDKELSQQLKKANSIYCYWDKFKYMPLPDDITPEEAWAYIKFVRMSSRKHSPVKDKNGDQFWYWFPDSVLRDLSFIDKTAAGEILVEEPSVASASLKDKFLVNSIMEEAIASSQLEGAATTRKKAKEMLRSGKKPINRAEQMIFNNYHAITWIKDVLNDPLTPELIREIQGRVTHNTLDDPESSGKFQNENEERVFVQYQNTTIFTPPRASEIDQRIDELCEFTNQPDSENEFNHPVIKGILLHFWLAYIHPFSDGNGRTARAIFYWYVLKNKYWLFEYLSISRIVLKAPDQYIRAYLYSEIDDLDLTYFITFHLRTIRLAIKEMKGYIHQKQMEMTKYRDLDLVSSQLNLRQSALMRHALENPDSYYTIKKHQNLFRVVYQTARSDLLSLEKLGLLVRKKIAHEFCFYPVGKTYDKLKTII